MLCNLYMRTLGNIFTCYISPHPAGSEILSPGENFPLQAYPLEVVCMKYLGDYYRRRVAIVNMAELIFTEGY